MDVTSLYLENLTFQQWIELATVLVQVEVRQRPVPLGLGAFILVALLFRRLKQIRLFVARRLLWAARLIGGPGFSPTPSNSNSTSIAPAPKPATNLKSPKSPESQQAVTAIDTLRSKSESSATGTTVTPSAPKKRHVARSSSRIDDAEPKQKTRRVVDDIPLSPSDELDGGDDLFLDALDSPTHSRDVLSNSSLSLKLDARLQSATDYSGLPTAPSVQLKQKEIESSASAITLSDSVHQIVGGRSFLTVPVDQLLTNVGLLSSHKDHIFSRALDKAVFKVLHMEHLIYLGDKAVPSWNLEWERNGISMYTLPVEGSSLPIVRGRGVVTGFTIPEVFSVIKSHNCRKIWDTRFEGGIPLAMLNPDDTFVHTIQKGSFPVAARDFIISSTTRRPSRSDLIHASASVNVETGDVPGVVVPKNGQDGRVRAQLDFSGWILRQLDSSSKKIETIYIAQVDPKGTIPSSLVKLVQNGTPLLISSIQSYLETNGPAPFILQVSNEPVFNPTSALTFTSESWNPMSQVYDFSAEAVFSLVNGSNQDSAGADKQICVPLAIPKSSFYASGCNLKVQLSGRNGAAVDGLIVKGGLVSATKTELLNGIVGDATMAVVLIWVQAKNGDATSVQEGMKFGLKLRLAKGGKQGTVFLNGEKIKVVGI